MHAACFDSASEAWLSRRRDGIPLINEAGELVAILTASAKTAKAGVR